jgi:hypothetical protein
MLAIAGLRRQAYSIISTVAAKTLNRHKGRSRVEGKREGEEGEPVLRTKTTKDTGKTRTSLQKLISVSLFEQSGG